MTIMMLPVGEVPKMYIPNLLRRYRRASAAIAIAQAEGLIGIDAAVAEIRPDAPHRFAAGEIDLRHQHLRLVVGARHHLALRAGDEAAAPELDAGADAGRVRFEADSVAGQHRQAVGDCMGALNGGPCLALARLLIIGVGWMPADGGGNGLEAEVARGEIEFFVIARVIRDVQLAVFAGDAAVAVEYHRRVVVKPGRTAISQRRNDHHAAFARERSERRGTRTRDGLGPIEKADVFVLAEITADVQLLQQY